MSETVTLTIDGKEISVPKGTSVIAAADLLKIEIPRFCWHPGLSVAGVCRFCMVKIEGMPKLQIACNTMCTEGMKVVTVSDEVKEAHKWALEFHLINHPLDCPICDQAGECELQNYYMKVGRYHSQMEEEKVLKPKALNVGKNLVLDTERCILCSRCVRFEDEVTKTSSLGIFQRGDHAIIGTFGDRKIEHNYSYNLVDICPVGAFTAKDFRFKCRVWFLSETKTICPGCSTGCNVTLFQQKNQREYYRLKPRHNPQVNGYWMCDYGRTLYHHLNANQRNATPSQCGTTFPWHDVPEKLKLFVEAVQKIAPAERALILTPQYTNEEYESIFSFLKAQLNEVPKVYVWRNAQEEDPESFDGILFRGDHHPNTQGLKQILAQHGLSAITLKKDFAPLASQRATAAFVFGPEMETVYDQFEQELSFFREFHQLVYFGNTLNPVIKKFSLVIPTKVFAEKQGTFVNYKGIPQKLHAAGTLVFPELQGIEEIFGQSAPKKEKSVYELC
jgi:NADH-quinone oxidoreductase subunit G